MSKSMTQSLRRSAGGNACFRSNPSFRLMNAPAMRGHIRPFCSRPSRFSDLSGEDIRSRMFLTAGQSGEELCLRPGFYHSRFARLSLVHNRRTSTRVFVISARSSAIAAACQVNFCRRASRSFGRTDKRRGRRRDAGAGARGDSAFRPTAPDIRIGDVGTVHRAGVGARSHPGLEAAAGEGFQSQGVAGAGLSTG